MNKFLELLEEYCQWIAIALGAVFLAWVLWSYILFTPVSITAADKTTLTPGNVDDYVKKMQAEPLQREIDDTTPPKAPIVKGGVSEPWDRTIAGTSAPIATLASNWTSSVPQDVQIEKIEETNINLVKVEHLPVPPPTKPLDIKAARAFVANGPAAPGAAPQPNVPGQAAAGRDVNYVRFVYSIDPVAIDKAFREAKIPNQASQTSILETKLFRQELVNGNWTDPVEVKRINFGNPIQPVPPANAGPDAITNFRTWAESDAAENDLVRPAFYPVLSGEGPWDAPVDDIQPVAAPTPKPEEIKKPVTPPMPRRGATPPPMPPEMPGEGGPRPGRSGGRRGSRLIQDNNRPQSAVGLAGLQMAQANPNPPFPGDPNFMNNGQPNPNGAMPNPGAAPAPQQPQALPPAVFAPNQVFQPFTGWAYDETAEEGHTYRYQVVYALRNPVYEANLNIVANQALAQQFAIPSPLDAKALDANAWSQPVTVKSTTEFYLAGPNWPSNNIPSNVRVLVYKWANGKWQEGKFAVSPGDKIGGQEAGIDYQTSDSLVDIRYDTRRSMPYVLVMNAAGQLVERDPTSDQRNPRQKQLKANVQAANGVPGGAPGAAPGGPPIGPAANAG